MSSEVPKRMLISIITTTINTPDFIKYYDDNINLKNKNIKFIVVGDRKTDDSKWNECDLVDYWDIDTQNAYLNKLSKDPNMNKLFPENNPLRRNFGYLRAIELGSDVIITVDDDNLPINCNFIDEHLDALNNKNNLMYSGFLLNPCDYLELNYPVYSRGYPITELFNKRTSNKLYKNNKDVMLNMGLWTNKPDVDSYFNIMYSDLYSKKYNLDHNVALIYNSYFPVNTQNTAVKKDACLIFHNVYMDMVDNYPLHRFDDIWGGLFTLKMIHNNNCTATFGNPIVEHRRNSHNYSKDLNSEFMGISINESIWNIVLNSFIENKDYLTGYLELADEIKIRSNFYRLNNNICKYLDKLSDCMKLWVDLVEKVK